MISFIESHLILRALTIFFAGYFEYVVVVSLLGYLLYKNYDRSRRALASGGAILAALIARFGVVALVRLFYDRARPFESGFVPLITHDPGGSFPSGHAAFFAALAVYFLLAKQKKMGLFLLAAALLISIGRVGSGIHYWSDVLVGGGIGLAVAVVVWYLIQRWNRSREAK